MNDYLNHLSFISAEENALAQEFQKKGYVVIPGENSKIFESMQAFIAQEVAKILNHSYDNAEVYLNEFHHKIDVPDLNAIRVKVISAINAQSWFRKAYYHLAKNALNNLVGNELAMQVRVNLSIQLPNDSSSLLPVHADVWSGDSPFEVVVWVPLVNCYQTKTMFILPHHHYADVSKNFKELSKGNSEDFYQSIEKDLEWVNIKAGEVLIFNQNLPHGNRINTESETRWSMNCRFKGVFTPYGDKKIGEFFEPITLKSLSQIGMNYHFPDIV
ncbi:MAG: sporadic carbohydrate cluster 2OG-Fe(II) oxygenase [Betaproteobacteria bacterium]